MKRTCPCTVATVALLALLALPGLALAVSHLSDTAAEVTATIDGIYAHTREHRESPAGAVASEGSDEFWSSGGLMNQARADAKPRSWESFNLYAKHIKVIPLTEGQVALAMYYLEGSMQPAGFPLVSHYMTRVSEVYVKENGKWKRRAAHWSAIGGGGGTSQSAE